MTRCAGMELGGVGGGDTCRGVETVPGAPGPDPAG